MLTDYGLSPLTLGLRFASPLLILLALFMGAYAAAADDGGPVMRAYLRYVSWLDRQLRLLFIFVPGRQIVLGQLGALYFIFTAQALIGIPYWYVMIPICIFGPAMWVRDQRQKRLAQIDEQLDTFMLTLSNALKSIPSVAAAFQSVVDVLPPPFSQEVDLAVKEMKLGSSLEQALMHMAVRIGSRQVDAATSSILIGRQVGGNLPRILEGTAEALREMRRLEGVVRTKTAEAKMQIAVIAGIPFAIVIGMHYFQPGYFDPVLQSFIGYVIITGCAIGWVSALMLARSILRVDI